MNVNPPLNLIVAVYITSKYIRGRIYFEANLSYQSLLYELPNILKVQKAGFQNQEDGALLAEGGNASVRVWYTRTGLPKFASYSKSNMKRSQSSLSKSAL